MFIYFYRQKSEEGFIDYIILKYEGVHSNLAMTEDMKSESIHIARP